MPGENERHPLVDDVEARLQENDAPEANLQAVLDRVLDHFACAAGTIHSLNPDSEMLLLRAQRGIPERIREQVQSIPLGKGMAGLAAQRRQPVQVCNLQTDASGVARPGAKETRMEGCLTVPLLVKDSLQGTIGIAKPTPYEFSAEETALLERVGHAIGKFLGQSPLP